MGEPCANLGQTFQPRSDILNAAHGVYIIDSRRRHFGCWPDNYTTGELLTLRGPQGRERVEPVYGTNSSGAPSDARPVRSRLDRGGMSLARSPSYGTR